MNKLVIAALAVLLGCGSQPVSDYTRIQCAGPDGKLEVDLIVKGLKLCDSLESDGDFCFRDAGGQSIRLRTGSDVCVLQYAYATPVPTATVTPVPTVEPPPAPIPTTSVRRK